jgi:hypothetical protein
VIEKGAILLIDEVAMVRTDSERKSRVLRRDGKPGQEKSEQKTKGAGAE